MKCPECGVQMGDVGTRFVCPKCGYDSCFGHEEKGEEKPNDDRADFVISMKAQALTKFRERFSDAELTTMLGDMASDAIVKPKDDDHFRGDYLSTMAAFTIIGEYGRVVDKRRGVVMKRLDCDLFQAAARHTGAIQRMTRYYGSSGKHMVHIPSLLKSAHGMIKWDWDYEGECQICPEKALCYDDREGADEDG